MDWVPTVFITLKVLVFGMCMFYAIKWHHDQGKKAKEEASRLPMPTERTPGASEYCQITAGVSQTHARKRQQMAFWYSGIIAPFRRNIPCTRSSPAGRSLTI